MFTTKIFGKIPIQNLFIEDLPVDCILVIFTFLSPRTLSNISLVSKSWVISKLATHDRIWKFYFFSQHTETENSNNKKNSQSCQSSIFHQISNEKDLSFMKKYLMYRKEKFGFLDFATKHYTGHPKYKKLLEEEPPNFVKIKIVFIGSAGCGKSALMVRMKYKKTFVEEYVPTVFDNYMTSLDFNFGGNKREIPIGFWDTAGQGDYDELRPLSYTGTDIFVIVMSSISAQSYFDVTSKWIPEIKQYASGTPIVLINNKIDLRDEFEEYSDRFVGEEEGRLLAEKEENVVGYFECSAKTGKGCFLESDKILKAMACYLAMIKKQRRRDSSKCRVM